MVYNRKKYKRWYVDAKIGKNVPIIGGTGFAAGSGDKQKRSLDAHIRKVVRTQVLEPKLYTSNSNAQASCLHNTIYTFNILRDIVVGTDENARLADTINVKSFKAKLNLYNPSGGSVSQNIYRVMIVKSKIANSTAGWLSSALGYNDIFWPGTTNDISTAMVNYNQLSVIHDQLVTLQPQITTGRIRKQIEISANIGKYIYEENVPSLGKFFQYFVVVIPILLNGTTGVTVAGDFDMTHCISFTDSK